MISRLLAGRVLVGVGILGVLSGLAGIVLGQMLVTSADQALTRTLVLTGETLDALQDAIVVAEETIALVEGGLGQAEVTTADLSVTVEDGAALLRRTADLTDERLATSLEAFETSLPGLIDVAAVIDRTLSALGALPFGPTYAPEEPFDESLRELQSSLAGVPVDLRETADLIRETGDSLEAVGDGATEISEDLAAIRDGMQGAIDVLRDSTQTATSASVLVGDTQSGLRVQLGLARALIVLLGLTTALSQLVPLAIGWTFLRGPDAVPLLRPEGSSGRRR